MQTFFPWKIGDHFEFVEPTGGAPLYRLPVLAKGSRLDTKGFAEMRTLLQGCLVDWFGDSEYTQWHLERLAMTLLQVKNIALEHMSKDSVRVVLIGEKGPTPLAFNKVLGIPWANMMSTTMNEAGEHVLTNQAGDQTETVTLVKSSATDRWAFEDNSQDLVIMTEVLEHLTVDPMAAFLEAHRVLAVGGILLMTTPNSASFVAISRALENRNPMYYSLFMGKGGGPTHVREYTLQEVCDLGANAGFEPVVESSFTTYYEEVYQFKKHAAVLEAALQNGGQAWADKAGSISFYMGIKTKAKQPTLRTGVVYNEAKPEKFAGYIKGAK